MREVMRMEYFSVNRNLSSKAVNFRSGKCAHATAFTHAMDFDYSTPFYHLGLHSLTTSQLQLSPRSRHDVMSSSPAVSSSSSPSSS